MRSAERRVHARGPMALIYVTGHRNPDADSIAAAIGYAELKRRLDPSDEYVPVRLGDPNAQTQWLIERSEAPLPELLPHVLLRVRDVMREEFPTARDDEPVREVGLTMAREGLDLVPIVDSDGALVGVMTERALARRYIRESREASRLDAPTSVAAIVGVLEGELEAGDEQSEISGRVWVLAMDVRSPTKVEEGDVVVVGRSPGRAAPGARARRGGAGHEQRHARGRRRARAGPRARGGGDHLDARLVRDRAHDHPGRALPRADGRRAAHRPP